jgi:murein DD-endopeptidase MepM/ murein hydrolase activator NlpD
VRILTTVIIALFTFSNVTSAKSRTSHRAARSHAAHSQPRIAHKTGKEHRAGRRSRIAHNSKKERRADRQYRVARRMSNQRSGRRQTRLAQRTNIEQRSEWKSSDQIFARTQWTAELATSSAPQNPATQKPTTTRLNPDLESAVIPPAPVIVKRSANVIIIPAEVAGLGSAAKSDTKPDTKSDVKFESKYEERPSVSSSVSVGSSFGYRRDPFTRRAKFHSGVDLKARWGDAVGASQAGIVQFAGWYHGYGNLIIVSHGGGVTTHYGHLSSFDVEPGAHVERGTIIGRAGSTGRATSPHLHYEVRIDGTATDPLQPLALDPSSEYFKLLRPTVDAGRGGSPSNAGASQDK